jgi:hypothetical protein
MTSFDLRYELFIGIFILLQEAAEDDALNLAAPLLVCIEPAFHSRNGRLGSLLTWISVDTSTERAECDALATVFSRKIKTPGVTAL